MNLKLIKIFILCAFFSFGCERKSPSEDAPQKLLQKEGSQQTDELAKEKQIIKKDALPKELNPFSLNAEITGIQIPVREEPDADGLILGWVRLGSKINLKPKKTISASCGSGWFAIEPQGWVCAGQGIRFLTEEHPNEVVREDKVPSYTYFLVKDPIVAEYHRLPSGKEEQQVLGWVQKVLKLQEDLKFEQEQGSQKQIAKKKQQALEEKTALIAQVLRGEGEGEFEKPNVVRRFLFRSFFVASAGEEERGVRLFLRTPQGSFVRLSQLEERTGSDFVGVRRNTEFSLPLAFTVRTARPLMHTQQQDGSFKWEKDTNMAVIPRQTPLENWLRKERIGNHFYHVLAGERFLREWFVGVAEKIDPPFEVEMQEPWVHVDLSEQTLVLYQGSTPVYATLVSSGLKEHETPTGVFSIEKKWVSATMSNVGPDAGDDQYRIEDVPWVQYFDGSIALHGAFWHRGFGLQKSHGCINLPPQDAKLVFEHLWPHVPAGWHGVNAKSGKFKTSKVYVSP